MGEDNGEDAADERDFGDGMYMRRLSLKLTVEVLEVFFPVSYG